MKTVLYARVSTSEQTIGHQRTQAEAAGFHIDEVVADDGVSMPDNVRSQMTVLEYRRRRSQGKRGAEPTLRRTAW